MRCNPSRKGIVARQPSALMARHVEKLARRAVRPRRVERDFAPVADHVGDEAREFADGDVFAGADIEELQVRIAFHDEDAGVGEVVDGEEFAPRRAGAPDRNACGAVDLGLVETPHQSRRNVAVVRMIIVAGPIEIGRHHRDKIRAMLQPVRLAQFDAGDLGDRVPLIGRLQRAGQQHVGRHRLRREPRIDAGRAEIDELAHRVMVRGANGVERDGEIVGEKIGRKRAVGADAADFAGGDEDRVGLRLRHEAVDRVRLPQVEIAPRGKNDIAVLAFEAAHDRGADHAGVARHKDALAA